MFGNSGAHIGLAGNEQLHVVEIVAAQGARVVFGMALHEHEMTVARQFAGENIGLPVLQTRQHPVALRDQIAAREVAAAAMRRRCDRRAIEKERIILGAGAVIDAAQFGAQRPGGDPVQLQHCGLCRQTRKQRGKGTGLGPVNQLRQLRPVRIEAHIRRLGLEACDDQGVEIGGLQEGGIVIKARHARAHVSCAWDGAQGKQPQTHIQIAGAVLEEPRELQFGGAQIRIGHVVEQPDLDGGAAVAAAQQKLFDPAHGEAFWRWPVTFLVTQQASKPVCLMQIWSRMKALMFPLGSSDA